AVELYFRKLAPDGVLALHVSNRYLELPRVVARIGEELDLAVYGWYDNDESDPGKNRSHWIALAHRKEDLGHLLEIPGSGDRMRWERLSVDENVPGPLWTDDFSNVLSVLSK